MIKKKEYKKVLGVSTIFITILFCLSLLIPKTTFYKNIKIHLDYLKVDKVTDIFKSEASLVRNQFISGTHAISTCLFALLRPGDLLLSITGKPYDTLDSIIGFNDNKSSLKSFGIGYRQVDLIDSNFDYDKIKKSLESDKIKVIEIHRSIGYSN